MRASVLDQLTRVLKPGGLVLVEDHSAKPGTGSTVASSLHRIDEAYNVRDFEKRGFKLVGKSDLLRQPDDQRELISYTPPGTGAYGPLPAGVQEERALVVGPTANRPPHAPADRRTDRKLGRPYVGRLINRDARGGAAVRSP